MSNTQKNLAAIGILSINFIIFILIGANHLKGEWHTGTETYQNQHECTIGQPYNLLRNNDLAVINRKNTIEFNEIAGVKVFVNNITLSERVQIEVCRL